MLELASIIAIVVAVFTGLISFFIFIRNQRSALHLTFFIFGLQVGVWIALNALAVDSNIHNPLLLIVNKLVFFFGLTSFLAAAFFIGALSQKSFSRAWFLLIIFSAIGGVASLTNFVISHAKYDGTTTLLEFGSLAVFYFALIVVLFLWITISLFTTVSHSTGVTKAQAEAVLISFGLSLTIIVGTNALLPFVFHSYFLADYGPFSLVFTVAGMAYAIARYKLFDLKLIVVRSFVYILSIAFVTLIISMLIFGFLAIIANDLRLWQKISYIFVTVLLALTYPAFKAFFDRVTNKFFFRDSYDAALLINEVNTLLVRTVSTSAILEGISSILTVRMKLIESSIQIYGQEGAIRKRSAFELNQKEIAGVISYLQRENKRSVSKDDLSHVDPLFFALSKKSISIIVPLMVSQKPLGVLLIGDKKSGAVPNSYDIRNCINVADPVALALQNAIQFEEISKFNVTLQQKIDDATKELRRTNEKLKALDEAKDEFISMASHQLRTPLTSMKGYVSMVLDGDTGDISEQQRMMLQQAFDSSQRMVYLISDLLNVSRLKTGKFVIENVRTNLANVVESEVNQIHEAALARGLELKFEKPHDFPELYMDETKTRQVIMNFIDNAMYYTPKDGRIDVALRLTDKSVEFTVNDTGVGVSPAEQKHLFTKFYRAQNARKMRPDGTGLGLYMAQKIIIAQGGAIIFKSKLGEGSTFGFSFPLDKVKLPAEAAALPAGNSTS